MTELSKILGRDWSPTLSELQEQQQRLMELSNDKPATRLLEDFISV